jgi:RNA polymerase sigma-70 factor (ECF subfamily)
MENTVTREEALRNQMKGLLPRLRRFARSLAKDSDRADDLVQAACERALNRLSQVREGKRLDSWLYRIIYTQWIDNLRRRKTRTTRLMLISDENKSDTPGMNSNENIDHALDLHNALNALPQEHHAAIMLICVEGYSYTEAAAVLEVPAGTVASRVARARAMLGKLLFNESPQIPRTKKHKQLEGRT